MKRQEHYKFNIAVAIFMITPIIHLNLIPIEYMIFTILAVPLSSNIPDIDQKIPIKHRGYSHTILGSIIVGLGVYWIIYGTLTHDIINFNITGNYSTYKISLYLALGSTIGCLMHITGDMLTKGGSSYSVKPFAIPLIDIFPFNLEISGYLSWNSKIFWIMTLLMLLSSLTSLWLYVGYRLNFINLPLT